MAHNLADGENAELPPWKIWCRAKVAALVVNNTHLFSRDAPQQKCRCCSSLYQSRAIHRCEISDETNLEIVQYRLGSNNYYPGPDRVKKDILKIIDNSSRLPGLNQVIEMKFLAEYVNEEFSKCPEAVDPLKVQLPRSGFSRIFRTGPRGMILDADYQRKYRLAMKLLAVPIKFHVAILNLIAVESQERQEHCPPMAEMYNRYINLDELSTAVIEELEDFVVNTREDREEAEEHAENLNERREALGIPKFEIPRH